MKEQVIKDAIRQFEWEVEYHTTQLQLELESMSPRQFEMSWERQHAERAQIKLDIFRNALNELQNV